MASMIETLRASSGPRPCPASVSHEKMKKIQNFSQRGGCTPEESAHVHRLWKQLAGSASMPSATTHYADPWAEGPHGCGAATRASATTNGTTDPNEPWKTEALREAMAQVGQERPAFSDVYYLQKCICNRANQKYSWIGVKEYSGCCQVISSVFLYSRLRNALLCTDHTGYGLHAVCGFERFTIPWRMGKYVSCLALRKCRQRPRYMRTLSAHPLIEEVHRLGLAGKATTSSSAAWASPTDTQAPPSPPDPQPQPCAGNYPSTFTGMVGQIPLTPWSDVEVQEAMQQLQGAVWPDFVNIYNHARGSEYEVMDVDALLARARVLQLALQLAYRAGRFDGLVSAIADGQKGMEKLIWADYHCDGNFASYYAKTAGDMVQSFWCRRHLAGKPGWCGGEVFSAQNNKFVWKGNFVIP